MPLLSESNDFSREQLEKFAGGKAQTGLEGQERFELTGDMHYRKALQGEGRKVAGV